MPTRESSRIDCGCGSGGDALHVVRADLQESRIVGHLHLLQKNRVRALHRVNVHVVNHISHFSNPTPGAEFVKLHTCQNYSLLFRRNTLNARNLERHGINQVGRLHTQSGCLCPVKPWTKASMSPRNLNRRRALLWAVLVCQSSCMVERRFHENRFLQIRKNTFVTRVLAFTFVSRVSQFASGTPDAGCALGSWPSRCQLRQPLSKTPHYMESTVGQSVAARQGPSIFGLFDSKMQVLLIEIPNQTGEVRKQLRQSLQCSWKMLQSPLVKLFARPR